MGDCRIIGGWEYAEIFVGDSVLPYLEPDTLPRKLSGWYLYHPRPETEDIDPTSITLKKVKGLIRFRFRIKRGSQRVMHFMYYHEGPFGVHKMDGSIMVCCSGCGEDLSVPEETLSWNVADHIPRYDDA